MTQDKQLALFPASATDRRGPEPAHLRLAKRSLRTLRIRGPLRVKDLALILGADVGDMRLAVGIARQWRAVEVSDGIVALAARGRGGAA